MSKFTGELKSLLSGDHILSRKVREETIFMNSTERLERIREIIDEKKIYLHNHRMKILLDKDIVVYKNFGEDELKIMTDDERMQQIYEHIKNNGRQL